MSNVNISDLTPAGAVNPSDLIEIEQGGVNLSATVSQIRGGSQAASTELTALAALNATGLVERTGANTYDTVTVTTLAKTLLGNADAPTMRSTLGAGTSATLDAPSSGNATSGQTVKGSDTRLTDSRTPTAHKASHATGGSDAIAPADIGAAPTSHTHTLSQITDAGTAAAKNIPLTGVNASTVQVVMGDDTRLTDARTPVAHNQTLSTITDAGTSASYDVPSPGNNATGLQVVRGDDTRLGIPADNSVTTAKIQDNAVTTAKIPVSAVTYARIQNVSSDTLLGQGASGGAVSEIPCTSAGRSMIGATDAAAQRTLLGLGTAALLTGTDLASLTGVQTLTNKTLTSPAITTPTGIVKGDVGLGNVDNTSDVNKPVSTAQATAIALKETGLGNPDVTGKVLSSTTGGVRSWTALPAVMTTGTSGLVPSGGDATKVLYGNATWAVPGVPLTGVALFKAANSLPPFDSAVPTLASNTGYGFVITPSSVTSSSYDGWYAFDGARSSGVEHGWTSVAGPPQSLVIHFPAAFAATSCVIYPYQTTGGAYTRTPTAFTIQGSDDGTTYTTLTTQTGISWASGLPQTFTWTNTHAYLYYKLNITANGGDTYVSISQLLIK